jgi:hypothetical protein
MRREEFEHLIAAAGEVSAEREIVVIGSQAVDVPPRVGQGEGAVALCLEVHDLVLAKCAAGRDRDWEFAAEAISAAIVRTDYLLDRVEDLPEPPADRDHIRRMVQGISERARRSTDATDA